MTRSLPDLDDTVDCRVIGACPQLTSRSGSGGLAAGDPNHPASRPRGYEPYI
jgi:hypothetical protein